jgi:hypothetical protein
LKAVNTPTHPSETQKPSQKDALPPPAPPPSSPHYQTGENTCVKDVVLAGSGNSCLAVTMKPLLQVTKSEYLVLEHPLKDK